MAQSLADLKAELAAVEDKMVAETDPAEVAVLAGRIIELKNEVAAAAVPVQEPVQAAPASKLFSSFKKAAPVPAPKPASESKPTPTPDVRKAQIEQATVDALAAKDAQAAAQAAAEAAATGTPAAKADAAAAPAKAVQSQTSQLAQAASRVGIDPSRIPIALRPTRN
jgi:hypothetical protein